MKALEQHNPKCTAFYSTCLDSTNSKVYVLCLKLFTKTGTWSLCRQVFVPFGFSLWKCKAFRNFFATMVSPFPFRRIFCLEKRVYICKLRTEFHLSWCHSCGKTSKGLEYIYIYSSLEFTVWKNMSKRKWEWKVASYDVLRYVFILRVEDFTWKVHCDKSFLAKSLFNYMFVYNYFVNSCKV